MRRTQFFGAFFWLVFSLFVCFEAFRLKFGTINMPGPGLFPFGIGVCMSLLSLSALVQALRKQAAHRDGEDREPFRWWNIVFIILAIGVYALTLPTVGFLINTFVFVFLLLKIVEPQSWKTALTGGLITAVAADILFNLIFQAQIPKGILGF